MAENPTVSVIIPTYNRAHIIGDAIESVLNQTFTDYEIIVVDDGSADDTAGVVAAYDQVRYIQQENAGSAVARTRGLEAARGRYIAFLDSDDLFLPTKLEKQVAYMDNHPEIGLSHTSFVDVTLDGEELHTTHTDYIVGWVYRHLLESCPIATPTIMLRREVTETVGTFDAELRRGQDIDYWMRVAKHYKFGALPEVLTQVRRHAGEQPPSSKLLLDYRLAILDKHFALSPELGAMFKRRIYVTKCYRAGLAYLNNTPPDQHLAWECFRRGAVRWPFTWEGIILGGRLLFRTVMPTGLQARMRRLWRREARS